MFLEKVADFDCFVGIGMLSVGMLKGCLINIYRKGVVRNTWNI